jgi:protein gp37
MKYWQKSWNKLYGCTKLRAGCTNCWALAMARRMQANGLLDGVVNERGEWTGKIQYKPERMRMPYSWKEHQIVAVDWMSDLFHNQVPDGVWGETYEVMKATPQHTYLILTKRYHEMMMQATFYDPGPLPNVYLGVTISNQKDANEAVESLYRLHQSGWKTWVSYEPAIEVVDWEHPSFFFLDGLICGGESGCEMRPMPPEAAIQACVFCFEKDIPFTFKQWSGKRGESQTLGGVHYQEFPEVKL